MSSALIMALRPFSPFYWLRRCSRKHDLTVVWPAMRARYVDRNEAMADAGCWLSMDWAWHAQPWGMSPKELQFEAACYRAFSELYGAGSRPSL